MSKKRIVVIFGSPHKNGYTYKLLESFLLDNKNNSIFFVDSYKLNAKPCLDCKFCRSSGRCYYRDLDEFYSKIVDSDEIIFASPIYNLGFPAPFKAIIDRMQCFYSQHFFIKDKKFFQKSKIATIILTCGSKDESNFSTAINSLKKLCTVINCKIKNIKVLPGTDLI